MKRTMQIWFETEVRETIGMVSEMQIGMVTELNMVGLTKSLDRWYNFGVTVHMCCEKSLSKTYIKVEETMEAMI